MTATVERPPTVSRARWYDPRTPWYARKKASDAWHRANRPIDVIRELTEGQQHPGRYTTEQLIERVPELFDLGMTGAEVCAEIGLSDVALEARFRKAGRPDLALPFTRMRNDKRRTKPCTECGKGTHTGLCRSCSNRQINLRGREAS